MKLTFTGYTKDGQVFFRNQKNISSEIINSGWKEFDITVEKKKKKRSQYQNAYYWGVVVALIRERFIQLGHDVSIEETHSYLKQEFNYKESVNEDTGDIRRFPMSSTELTTSQFCDYIARIQKFASEILDLYIPEPGTQLSMSELETGEQAG